MDDGTVFVKTPKGVEELKQRTYGLPSRTRQILIMADGKRDRAAIAELISVQDINAVLTQLVQDGFLALAAPQAAATDEKPGVPDFIVPTDPQQRLIAARNFIINTTDTYVGPFGSGLAEQARKANTSAELRRLIDVWEEAIISGTDKKRGAELKERLLALLRQPL